MWNTNIKLDLLSTNMAQAIDNYCLFGDLKVFVCVLNDIKKAQPWRNPDDFEDRFDKMQEINWQRCFSCVCNKKHKKESGASHCLIFLVGLGLPCITDKDRQLHLECILI